MRGDSVQGGLTSTYTQSLPSSTSSREGGDRLGRREAWWLAGAQVEGRAVQPALDGAAEIGAADLALAQATAAWEQRS